VRHATASDIPAIVDMARAFSAAHGEDGIDESLTASFVANAIQSGCVLVSEGSFLIGFLAPDPSKGTSLVAHEAFWWSSTGKGQDLREAFEVWAKENGASEVQFSHPWRAERVGRMLEQAGYEPATKVWRKVI
jgi:hypothetical protein